MHLTRHINLSLLALPVLLSTSCGHPLPADEERESYLDQSCSLFCEQAITCSDVSSQHINQWEANTLADCEFRCIQMAEQGAEFSGRPECADRFADLWTCAAMLETCEEFEWFEHAAFGMAGPFEMWCGLELVELNGCT